MFTTTIGHNSSKKLHDTRFLTEFLSKSKLRVLENSIQYNNRDKIIIQVTSSFSKSLIRLMSLDLIVVSLGPKFVIILTLEPLNFKRQ